CAGGYYGLSYFDYW
nr:immunoglobulin heavy chain junction region [Mus musculus]